MVRLDTRLDLGRRDLNKLLVMGYGTRPFRSVTRVVRRYRNVKIAQELAEDLDEDPPVYAIWRGNTYVFVVLRPHHVHVINLEKQLSEEEARRIVERIVEELRREVT